MTLSVLIPVYKKPKLVGDIVGKLLADAYPEKDIRVVVDGLTNPEIEAALEPHRASISIRYNGEQLGKAKSLNELARGIESDCLVFFDNDIRLGDDPGFLTRVAKEFKRHDLMEFPKEAVADSFISKVLSFEYLSNAISTFAFAAVANHCPSMNGAAFAIKRELFERLGGFRYMVNEDMDLAFRAFLSRAKFSYSPALKVRNDQPDDFREWISQRKRWAINNVSWFKVNFTEIARNFFKNAKFRRAALVIFMPIIIYSALFFLMRLLGLTTLYPFMVMIGMNHHMLFGLLLGLAHFHLIMDGAIPVLLGFGSALAFNFIFAKILKFSFNFPAFLLFYALYLPVWFGFNLVFGVGVFFNVKFNLDWKVAK